MSGERSAEEVARGLTADDGGVLKRWIIVHEPGLVPEKKRPITQTSDGVLDFLLDLKACRPEGTTYTVVCLTWDHDLWVSSGEEELAIDRLCHPHLFRKRVKASAERLRRLLSPSPGGADA